MHQDYRLILALAHYSLKLSSVFVFEYCFTYLMLHHFNTLKQERMKADELFERGMQLANIFRSEHILIDNLRPETFYERVSYFSD